MSRSRSLPDEKRNLRCGIPSELPLRCFDRAGEAAISLSCEAWRSTIREPPRRSQGRYYFNIKRRRRQARFPIPRAASPCERWGNDTTGNRAMTTNNLALAASIMMLATISGPALAGTVAPKAQYWRERPIAQTIGRYALSILSIRRWRHRRWSPMRTVIMADRNPTIDPHDLERFGTIILVGLPSSAANKRPQLECAS
jgi:hypothetical protein